MTSRFWNVNKKGNIDPIQNFISLQERKMFAILTCYCRHFVLKIISSEWLPSRAIHSWSLTLKFCSARLVIISGIADFTMSSIFQFLSCLGPTFKDLRLQVSPKE
jgi:hypothetical protein